MGTILKCNGLKTFDNELSNTEGYLTIADNIVIDKPNVAEPRRGLAQYGDTLPSSTDRLKQVLVYKDLIIRHFDTTLQFDSVSASGTFTDFTASVLEPTGTARIKYKEANGNLYFTSNSGIRKISETSASNIATGSVEYAGGPKGLDLTGQLDFTSAGFLPPQSKVAYRIVWGKRDNNNNVILGTPSPRLVMTNTSEDIDIAERVTITTVASASITDGSYILMNSEFNSYGFYADKTGSTTAPSASDTLNRTMVAVDISSLTTADEVAIAFAQVISQYEFTVEVSGSTITVTSTEEGADLTDAQDSAVNGTGFTVSVIIQGQVQTGTSANVDLNFTIPNEVTTDEYFYQVYRTGVVTAPDGFDLNDVEVGDDHNFLFEGFPTSAELTAREIEVNDFTPESFREQGAFLYTNPTTGQGINQANDKPPVAKDIELFRNHMFYANTSTYHRLTLRVLSVNDFVSGTSGIKIGNDTDSRTYTFVGATQVQDIQTVADVSDSLDGTYFLINSARNERKYYVWLSTGAGASDPEITGRIAISVDINTNDTAGDIATEIGLALDATGDFSTSVSTDTITVTWAKNGVTDNASDGDTGFTFSTPSTEGDGEDTSNNDVLLSSLASVGQAIDETARSLVRVINRDTDSIVRATYLSSPDDLPGILLLESKNLGDGEFYIGSLDALGAEFDPTLPEVNSITAISIADPAQITSTGHGLTTGNEIYISETDSTPELLGKYTVTVLDANTFTVPVQVTSSGTTGTWFLADVVSDNEVTPNRLYYSKFQQPEAVPILNYIDIGPRDKGIQRILALRDNLIVMKEDGIYLVTGTTSPFNFRLVDSSVQVLAPDTAVILNNQIYALTSQGIATISDSSPYIISTDIEDQILGIANPRFDFELTSFGVAYESERSYLIALPTEESDTVATQMYRYNYFTRAWTRWDISGTCGIVNKGNDKLYIGDGGNDFLRQERKNDSRSDYADLDFTLSIPSDSVGDQEITLSNASQVEVGDVIYQQQTITIYRFNNLLRRLDIDNGLDDTDYFSTLEMSVGENITDKLDTLNAKLVADDSSGTISTRTFSTNWITLATEYNTLIGELNNVLSDTSIKSYDLYTTPVSYEVIVTDIPFAGNTVGVNKNVPFLQGSVIIYKGIQVDIEWAPQHFGDTQLIKQVRDATLMFDQNNFFSGTIGFKSDISQTYEYSTFSGRGVGDFGYGEFGGTNFGGKGSETPIRRIVPRNKQRCRFLRIRFMHINAREHFEIVGITMNPRSISKRGYR